MHPITGVVYKNRDVEFVFRDGSYSVRAKSDIPAGTLVLLEHVVYGNMADMYSAVMTDTVLLESLYPREKDASDHEKIHMNVFGFEDNVLVLGDKISKFNHCCRPNSYLTHGDTIGDDRTYAVFAFARVKRGEELTFDYTNGHSEAHDTMKNQHGYSCKCTAEDVAKSPKWSEVARDLAHRFRDEMAKDKTIPRLVDLYFSKRRGRLVSMEQVKARAIARGLRPPTSQATLV